MEPHTKI
jgi:hypothetical protein